jgi:hypothetical protein
MTGWQEEEALRSGRWSVAAQAMPWGSAGAGKTSGGGTLAAPQGTDSPVRIASSTRGSNTYLLHLLGVCSTLRNGVAIWAPVLLQMTAHVVCAMTRAAGAAHENTMAWHEKKAATIYLSRLGRVR